MRRFLARLLRGPSGRATAARTLAIGLALLAPLAPPHHVPDPGQSVVYVVDRSRSVGAEGLAEARELVRAAHDGRGQVEVGVVSFGPEADVEVPVGGSADGLEAGLVPAEGRGSDLAAGLRLAAAALPESGRRRVVVLSDGRATGRDPMAEVERARREGITVDTVAIGAGRPDAPAIGSLSLDHARVSVGEPVEATAVVRGTPGASVGLAWTRDAVIVRTETVTLNATGEATARLTDGSPEAGAHVYGAELLAAAPAPSSAAIDEARALAIVEGRPTVLVLTSTGERPSLLLDALDRAEAEVRFQRLEGFELTDEALDDVDLVVLADVAIARDGEVTLLPGVGQAAQERLIRYVGRQAGGLLVLGGSFGFGPEYAGTALARLLPVEVQDDGEIHNPRVALTINLDRSGSMGAYVGSHTKLQLAIEAALAAASTLRPDDRVGIAAVDEITHWYHPLGPAAGLARVQARIRSIEPGGGGIFVYTALADAYGALQRTPEPVRHVILFSDTADSEEQHLGCPFMPCDTSLPYAVDLARNARAAGITTSVVGIGSAGDPDTRFLRILAAAGGGRFYLTSTGTDLRRIFISETRAATRSNLHEEPVEVGVAGSHPALQGLDLSSMPPITGYVETGLRATADTPLRTPEGHPVLASWRYGLGTVTAWTTDAGERWTSGWATWPGAGQLMRQLLRATMRRRDGAGADARVAVLGDEVEVTIEAPEAEGEEAAAPASVELAAIGPTGQRTTGDAVLERVAPGRWIARGQTGGQPFVHARVRDSQGRLLAEAVGSGEAATELTGQGPDRRALADLARAGDGMVDPAPAATLRRAGPIGEKPVATWPWLLLAAALLVAMDLWLRRLGRARARRLEELVGLLPARQARQSS